MRTSQPRETGLKLPASDLVADETVEDYELDPFDPGVARLQKYQAATLVEPRPDLVRYIVKRIRQEPEPTPSRRFITAIRAHDRASVARAFRQALAVALGAGTVQPIVRAQAAVLVLVVLVTSGFSGAAVVAGTGVGLEYVAADTRDASLWGSTDQTVDKGGTSVASGPAGERSRSAAENPRAGSGPQDERKGQRGDTSGPGKAQAGESKKAKDRADAKDKKAKDRADAKDRKVKDKARK